MRIVFAGTPDFAAVALNALLTQGHEVVAVYTQPDRPSGRGRKLTPSPVKQVAQAAGLPVCQPETLKSADAQAEIAAFNADVMIVAAYGLILPQAVLDMPVRGCLNIHASLLPRWRGAAPIQRAIAAGDEETGITIMQMEAGLDTGAMLLKLTTPIHDADTGGNLHDRLADLGGQAILTALDELEKGGLKPEPQNDALASYAHKLNKEEGHLDWGSTATDLARRVRAFNPWPGTFARSGDEKIRIHAAEAIDHPSAAEPGAILKRDRDGIDVACASGVLRLHQVQLPGARGQSISDLINGGRAVLQQGEVLR
ncbi:methionyl-tRNA formyltransferase [Marinobacter fonticola]|uniref:methionyl-tRNA formyltransferase n=1 Tax=Marinobacter fonticola TaxID=2603215 RepID=UPI0011E7F546|nr:methionyl-tRNA formyltransferase [Marinobacter fonticola]